eukprot:3440293-Lingulodinium_polyedra.AAC.1
MSEQQENILVATRILLARSWSARHAVSASTHHAARVPLWRGREHLQKVAGYFAANCCNFATHESICV